MQLPDKYLGFLLIQALCLSEQDIKSLLNYTRGSILTKDIKDYVRKHETKLQVSQVGDWRRKQLRARRGVRPVEPIS